MKRFLKKTLLFALILLIMAVMFDILLIVNVLRLQTSPFATWNDIYRRNVNADVLIMGSSRAFVQFNPAIIDSVLHKDSYNLGMNGRSADSQILKYKVFRHRNNPKPKLVIYEVSHNTMHKSNGYEREQFVPYLHDQYLWRLCHEQEGFTVADFVLPCWRFLGRQSLMKKILFPTEKSEYDLPLYKGFRSYDRKWSGDGLKQQTDVTYYSDTAIISQFRDFLDECRQDSISVVMVTSPFYIGGTRKMSDSDGMHTMFEQIAEDFNIPYLDYTYDTLSYDTAYFYNTMHLNSIGANIFSQKMARDVDSILRNWHQHP